MFSFFIRDVKNYYRRKLSFYSCLLESYRKEKGVRGSFKTHICMI